MYKPYFLRGPPISYFPILSASLTQVYRAPGSTAEIERKHKIGSQVQRQRGCRLNDLCAQRQVAVVQNRFQFRRDPPNIRGDTFDNDLPPFVPHRTRMIELVESFVHQFVRWCGWRFGWRGCAVDERLSDVEDHNSISDELLFNQIEDSAWPYFATIFMIRAPEW